MTVPRCSNFYLPELFDGIVAGPVVMIGDLTEIASPGGVRSGFVDEGFVDGFAIRDGIKGIFPWGLGPCITVEYRKED